MAQWFTVEQVCNRIPALFDGGSDDEVVTEQNIDFDDYTCGSSLLRATYIMIQIPNMSQILNLPGGSAEGATFAPLLLHFIWAFMDKIMIICSSWLDLGEFL